MKNFNYIVFGFIVGLIITCIPFFYVFEKQNINTKSFAVTDFNITDQTFTISGILNPINANNDDKRYTKSIEYHCDLFLKECYLLTANYVNNGKLQPSLYPSYTDCKILNQENKRIITQCNACTVTLDILKEDLTIVCPSVTYNLKK